jgi:hypothetical protein
VLGILDAVAFFGDTITERISFGPFAADAGDLASVDEC